jgi:cell division protein DivIC
MQQSRNHDSSGKRSTASQRRSRLWMFGVCCFLAWAGFNLWDQGAQHSAKAEQLAEMEAKLGQVKAQNEAYQLEVTRLNDSEYIEQKIRKDYHYTRDGETMFYTPKSNP